MAWAQLAAAAIPALTGGGGGGSNTASSNATNNNHLTQSFNPSLTNLYGSGEVVNRPSPGGISGTLTPSTVSTAQATSAGVPSAQAYTPVNAQGAPSPLTAGVPMPIVIIGGGLMLAYLIYQGG